MKKLLLILCISCTFAKAQSLVVNYDLESYNTCPQALYNILDANNCTAPSDGSPDYFNVCGAGTLVGVPNNVFGIQDAHSGDGYVGLWAHIDGQSPYREYVLLELSTPLVVGKPYDIKFYVTPGGRFRMGCDGIGMWLTTSLPYFPGDATLPVTPQILHPTPIVDTTNWTEVGSIFVADQAYTHLVIGNFHDPATVQAVPTGPLDPILGTFGAYMYVDDVLINEQPDTIIPPPPVVIIIPDVFTPSKEDGTNDTFVIQDLPGNSHLTIYNRWGNKVYESANYQNNWDGEKYSDGVYFYILNTPDGKDYHGTVTKL